MNRIKQYRRVLLLMGWLPVAALLLTEPHAQAIEVEETFDVLQTKTGTYENVTVTSKTKDWIFILHASGMGNVKIADLPENIQEKLGYTVAKEKSKPVSVPTMDTLTDIKLPEMQQLQDNWREGGAAAVMKAFGDPIAVWTLLGIGVLLYLFFCYCSMMICRKAHTSPGFLVWVPVLQFIPLLRAAGMSGVWLVAFLVPVVNLIAQIIWYVKIVQARGKGPLLVLWLLLPLTAPFAYLYLAFSEAAPIRIVSQHVPLALEIS
jgi:hypothetical protein